MDSSDDAVALNADVVGYSALVADDLAATSAAMSEYHQIVERAVSGAGGTLANFVGDSFMAVFDTPTDAIRAAMEISSAAEARNEDLPSHRHVRFRMGMDMGPVSVTDGGYHGDALNIAARIQAIARPGGLGISGRVYRALDEPALRFRPIGSHRLKNIPEHVDVYEFTDPAGGADSVVPGQSLSLEAPTVAVLPIHVEGVDDQVASAAAMIRSDIVHRLASVPDLSVVDVGSEPDPRRSAATVARYMLETGVHQFGDSVRVYATMFDVTTMNIVKSHKHSGQVSSMLDLSDRLAEEVAHTIQVDLLIGAPAGLYAEMNDPEAVEKIQRGWYHLRTDTAEGWARSLALFGEVAESHPDRSFGYVLSAFATWIGAANGWADDTAAGLAEAMRLARRGNEVGDPSGMATAVEAAVLMSEGRVEDALVTLDGLEKIRPTCDVTYGLEGSVRRYLGQWERAVELLDMAMRLTGINKPWYPTVKACSLFLGDRNEEAAFIAESVLDYQPNNLEALLVLAAAQVELGMDRKARATAGQVLQLFPSVDVGAWLEKSPYQKREIVERWKSDLESTGAITRS